MALASSAHHPVPVAAAGPISVAAWLYPSDPASFAALRREAQYLTRAMPAWYTINADLSISSRAQGAVIRYARSQGLALVPLIRNAGFDAQVAQSILETPARRRITAERIAGLVLAHDYAGINIDFEGPFGAYRDAFTDFMARLAGLLHPVGKYLSVDVAPQLKPLAQYPETSWAAPYDYPALAQVCDAVILMAYDHSLQKPGSLSPLWWVRDATTIAHAQIAPRKLVVGQAFYGRHWVVNSAQITHTDLTQAAAEALLTQSGAPLQRPIPDATPRFTWEDAQGQHIVHYEDAVSLATKLQAVLAHGAGGLAFWRLGQEESTQWDVIAQAVQRTRS